MIKEISCELIVNPCATVRQQLFTKQGLTKSIVLALALGLARY